MIDPARQRIIFGGHLPQRSGISLVSQIESYPPTFFR
jgi:hypothetical protein